MAEYNNGPTRGNDQQGRRMISSEDLRHSAPNRVAQPKNAARQRPVSQSKTRSRKPAPKKTNPLASLISQKSAPKTRITTTTRNGIKMYEDRTDYSRMNDDNATYYEGEVYFAAKNPAPANSPARTRTRKPKNSFEAFFMNLSKAIRDGGQKGTAIYLAVLLLISIFISIYTMSFINDILAFNRSDEVATITVGENATTAQVIKQLDKAGLIKHGSLCKIFMGLTSSLHSPSGKEPVYLSGVYYLTPSMGLEKMLLSCQEIQKAETVTVTIPEGFTIEQIAKKLEKAGVCMSDEFYNNIEKANFSTYKFIAEMPDKASRYHYLEGYLYPDTYEFFVGQNASSVINKLLENSEDKWTDAYETRANEMGLTMDDVLTLASIIQKEAGSSEQMPVIAKIFFNRLNSTGFPSLQSDATNFYVNTYIKPNVTSGEYDTYWARYSTYACKGLPVGPICNPGKDAIEAVLWPDETDAYYFCHDKSGKMYTAKTEAEHNANYYKTLNTGN